MICDKCGLAIDNDVNYCSMCGYTLKPELMQGDSRVIVKKELVSSNPLVLGLFAFFLNFFGLFIFGFILGLSGMISAGRNKKRKHPYRAAMFFSVLGFLGGLLVLLAVAGAAVYIWLNPDIIETAINYITDLLGGLIP